MTTDAIKFQSIDTSDATVHVAIVEGDLEYAVMTYNGRAYQNARVVIYCCDDLMQDVRFPSLKAAVEFAAEYLVEEYQGAY